ncbi:Crp/Fnr family transcriptional regulator [Siphonobacter sp. SORGH_AS_0500]|uniref:Crp/Fnr family transcriptional regulator n=1 Tax=Siphonobacter sp. SORGH_AS_0500 TaxID=1864824 RepID=UPI00285E20AB|nr:Crp/Fnr family transcriptional regulator [Siphonobacter sp. SORGH_AS_0500]MDR6196404.1 CRP-like cAMP-binding protein [Siphonobacter sp. SORGH_AS_0500]
MITVPAWLEEMLNSTYELSQEDWIFLATHLQRVTFKKKEIILEYGQMEQYMYFLEKGLVRLFTEKNDREVCLDFIFEKQAFSSFISLSTQKPSTLCIQTLVPSTVIRLPLGAMRQWLEGSDSAERLVRRLIENRLVDKLQKEIKMLTMTAEENYESLLNESPNIVQQIPIKDMASYLGIHPDSLSRIRKRTMLP